MPGHTLDPSPVSYQLPDPEHSTSLAVPLFPPLSDRDDWYPVYEFK